MSRQASEAMWPIISLYKFYINKVPTNPRLSPTDFFIPPCILHGPIRHQLFPQTVCGTMAIRLYFVPTLFFKVLAFNKLSPSHNFFGVPPENREHHVVVKFAYFCVAHYFLVFSFCRKALSASVVNNSVVPITAVKRVNIPVVWVISFFNTFSTLVSPITLGSAIWTGVKNCSSLTRELLLGGKQHNIYWWVFVV